MVANYSLITAMDCLWFFEIVLVPESIATSCSKRVTTLSYNLSQEENNPMEPLSLVLSAKDDCKNANIETKKVEKAKERKRPTRLRLDLIRKCEVSMNYYTKSCPNAESIIKEQVRNLYDKHGNTAVSWVRNLFHDCMVKSCDASILLDSNPSLGIETEKDDTRNFGMRNFKYINTIKEALEAQCPLTVSCADIIALSARDGVHLLGGPDIPMKTGRRDSIVSYATMVQDFIPNHNSSISLVISRFGSIGIDIEATVAILGAHSVGRVHCVNLVDRLYPTIDPTIDSDYATYLKHRCPTPDPDPEAVVYARNDRETPMILDNMYYNNLLAHKGLLLIDQELVSNPSTLPYVQKMAIDNEYFHQQFSRAMILLSQNNPLVGNQGEIRMDCRFINGN